MSIIKIRGLEHAKENWSFWNERSLYEYVGLRVKLFG